MNKYTKKLRKKYTRRDKKKHTNRKNKRNTNVTITIESRFKNLNAKTIKEMQKKFRKERLLLENKHIINREQIGCANNRKKNMKGGVAIITDVMQKIEDVGVNAYNDVLGYEHHSNQDPTYQPYLAENTNA